MRLLTFEPPGSGPRLGLALRGAAVDLARAAGWLAAKKRRSEGSLPADMLTFLDAGPGTWDAAGEAAEKLAGEELSALRDPDGETFAWPLERVRLRAPLPHPRSLRDFYAFEQHVRTAFSLRGQSIPPEWYEFPVFYFGGVASFCGAGDAVAAPAASQALDFELEVAAIIGRGGRNLDADQAEAAIFGYTILNDWSARDLQRKEMRVGLGPAKGKDFATTLGPAVVTPDELADRRTGRPGVFDAVLRARINGVERSRGNWKDIHYSFGDMLARASADVTLEPGDVIGSGTVGSGCLLELTAGQGPWLQPGDVVELEIEGLGVLQNTVASGEWPVASTSIPADH